MYLGNLQPCFTYNPICPRRLPRGSLSATFRATTPGHKICFCLTERKRKRKREKKERDTKQRERGRDQSAAILVCVGGFEYPGAQPTAATSSTSRSTLVGGGGCGVGGCGVGGGSGLIFIKISLRRNKRLYGRERTLMECADTPRDKGNRSGWGGGGGQGFTYPLPLQL